MYKEFDKLRLDPFETTSNPSFRFLTGRHKRPWWPFPGVQRAAGSEVPSTDRGRRHRQDTDAACAYLFNSRASRLEFLLQILDMYRLSTRAVLWVSTRLRDARLHFTARPPAFREALARNGTC